jgi:hypothetical protein
MKLVDLVEGYHQIKKQVYDIGLFVQDEFAEYVGINLDIDVIDYGAFISNPAGVITNILQDVTSTIITKYPDKNITIYEMKVIGRFKDLPGTILIGNLKSLFDTGGRRIPIIVDNIWEVEGSIQEYADNLNIINLPSEEECMTKIKREHKLVIGVLRRKVSIKSVEIEINPYRNLSTAMVNINPMFDEKDKHDEVISQFDQVRVKLKKLLEPYGINLILDTIGMEI